MIIIEICNKNILIQQGICGCCNNTCGSTVCSISIAQSADWHAFCGSSVSATQSADCANSQIAWNIYIIMSAMVFLSVIIHLQSHLWCGFCTASAFICCCSYIQLHIQRNVKGINWVWSCMLFMTISNMIGVWEFTQVIVLCVTFLWGGMHD